ncbi:MAG: glycosyltransferase [Nanobdellota archaeon]
MRIAIFTDTFLPQINGVVTSTVNLAKRLADRGHTVYIIAPRFNEKSSFKYPRIHIRRVPGIRAGFYEDFKLTPLLNPLLYKYIQRQGIDIYHFQTPMSLGFEAVLLGRFFGKPVIGTFHTFFAEKEYLKHCGLTSEIFERLAWGYATFFYNQATLVTSPSPATKKELVKQGCKRPIEVISNGIELEFDNSRSDAVRRKHSSGGLLLLFVGRMAHEKNPFFLMEVMRILKKKDSTIRLLMVGDGPQKEEIMAKAPDTVEFLGLIEHAALIKSGIFGACDVFVTASKTENQPMTLLEAQANGLVCVGPKAQGIPDLIGHNQNGLLVEPDSKKSFVDAILSLRDVMLRKKLADCSRESIKEHDMERVVDRWEEIYEEARA